MLKTQKCVYEMMKAIRLPLPNEERPGVKNLNFELLRELVREEAQEFDKAMRWLQTELLRIKPDKEAIIEAWADVIDAACDIEVVLHNTTNAMGLDIEPFFDEVHRTNMQKADGPLREDGKRLKPPGWKPPRIEEMLKELLSRHGGL